jgi:hypothetical protein
MFAGELKTPLNIFRVAEAGWFSEKSVSATRPMCMAARVRVNQSKFTGCPVVEESLENVSSIAQVLVDPHRR